jgi:hypothetical protein
LQLGYIILPPGTVQKVTRLVCWFDLAARALAWPLGAIFFVWLLVSPALAIAEVALDWRSFLALGVLWGVVLISRLMLFLRTCDQCGGRLFRARDEKRPHVRTKSLLGSQQLGAEWEMARTGTVHCRWCGHADGTPIEYVRVGAEPGAPNLNER